MSKKTEWTTCKVCGCKYAQSVMPNGKLSGDTTCPALKINKHNLNTCGELWRERALKHNPEWDNQ